MSPHTQLRWWRQPCPNASFPARPVSRQTVGSGGCHQAPKLRVQEPSPGALARGAGSGPSPGCLTHWVVSGRSETLAKSWAGARGDSMQPRAGAARGVDSCSLAGTEPGTPGCRSHDVCWSETALARPGVNHGILSLLEIRPPPHPRCHSVGNQRVCGSLSKARGVVIAGLGLEALKVA